MNIDLININDIKMADYNPRIISNDNIDKLKNSIDEFGLVDPIIINSKTKEIIGGHQRFKILKNKYDNDFKLNVIYIGDIGWVYDNDFKNKITELDEKALNIALNKISGDWDKEKLDDLIDDLNLFNYDVSLTGFDVKEEKEEYNLEEFDINNYDEEIDIEEKEELFKLLIEISDENEQEKLYNFLTNEGYNCRLLIL